MTDARAQLTDPAELDPPREDGGDASDAAGVADEAPKAADLTGRVAVYPSALIRPIPPFVLSIPQGWLIDEAPESLAVIRLPEQVDDFWVNAILSHDRVARSVDFEAAAKATWARLQETTPTATVAMERLARFGTNIVYLRGVELEVPDSGRKLEQLHALWFAPAPEESKTVDLFQLIGTSPAEHMERFGPAFVEMVGSFRFTPVA